MLEFQREALKRLEAGEPLALALIYRTRGSTPGRDSFRMLVNAQGRVAGSVGGGCLEGDVIRAARGVLETGRARTLSFRLTPDQAQETGLICGGEVDVYVAPVDLAAERALLEAIEHDRPLLRATLVSGPDLGRQGWWSINAQGGTPPPSAQRSEFAGLHTPAVAPLPRGSARRADSMGPRKTDVAWQGDLPEEARTRALAAAGAIEDRDASEVLDLGPLGLLHLQTFAAPTLIIAGAGHVGAALAPLAGTLGFRVWVLDDRAQAAARPEFQDAGRRLVGDLSTILSDIELPRSSYLVVVTRGHQHDELCLEAALARPFRYIGVIGSRAKLTHSFRSLRARGCSVAALRAVHAPIGLDIGARTAEEIAVAVAAELIAVRRGVDCPQALSHTRGPRLPD